MTVPRKDQKILRDLGRRVAEIAAQPIQQETINCWKALNSLKPVRPMVMLNHIPWHEMDVNGALTLQTEDKFCRSLESKLRRILYSWKHLRADMVVEPFIRIPKVIYGLEENLGLNPLEKRSVTDPQNRIVGHYYIDQLENEEALEKIRVPEVVLDEQATARAEEQAEEIFQGIIDIRMEGHFPRFTPWDRIVEWRGAEKTLIDLAQRPEFMHKIIARSTDAFLARLDQLEQKGLLGCDQGVVKSSGAYTDELPAPGFDPQTPRPKDIWTSGMAQIFAAASPAMHKEFELDYAVRWYKRFGLVYYGCCEPLHAKLDIVSQIPNLRKISMSPWVEQEQGAEAIGSKFVFSRKPNPAFLAGNTWDPELVRRDLEKTAEICGRYECPVEFILQDISTVAYQPQRLWEWVDIAGEVARDSA